MRKLLPLLIHLLTLSFFVSASPADTIGLTAAHLLGNPAYPAICYGGYRSNTRDIEPSVAEIKEDLKILAALQIKVIRTYNVHHQEITHLLQAITALKKELPHFEMYVMLGAWIDCKNAWTSQPPIHNEESSRNETEINEAIRLANQYPDIVKIITVGNEAMVHWATSYFVTPAIILKWVKHLQRQKQLGKLPSNVWITSSDNFASWGGGDTSYHVPELKELIQTVDYLSVHTYPMHDTHYNPTFWGTTEAEKNFSPSQKIDAAMLRAVQYAKAQYESVVRYMQSLGVNKPVHIGETGWATYCNELYGKQGSQATDEYKAAFYYHTMREWTKANNITCFYFEAFDENWKNSANPQHSENHFGLINQQGEVKFALWPLWDQGLLQGLRRNGKLLRKSYGGDEARLWQDVTVPAKIIQPPTH
jgi:exo-beta-1,3-glucanase (GH17 family)